MLKTDIIYAAILTLVPSAHANWSLEAPVESQRVECRIELPDGNSAPLRRSGELVTNFELPFMIYESNPGQLGIRAVSATDFADLYDQILSERLDIVYRDAGTLPIISPVLRFMRGQYVTSETANLFWDAKVSIFGSRGMIRPDSVFRMSMTDAGHWALNDAMEQSVQRTMHQTPAAQFEVSFRKMDGTNGVTKIRTICEAK